MNDKDIPDDELSRQHRTVLSSFDIVTLALADRADDADLAYLGELVGTLREVYKITYDYARRLEPKAQEAIEALHQDLVARFARFEDDEEERS